MQTLQSGMNDRIKAAVGAVLLQGLLGYALIAGLAVNIPEVVTTSLKVFEVAPVPPPPVAKPPEPPAKTSKPKGEAAPPNLKAEPTQIVAPPPVLLPRVPPPVVAAPIAGVGNAASAGASDIAGPGTGAGGQGVGRGGGGEGQTPPRRIRGDLKDSDFPRGTGDAGVGQTLTVQFTVEANGRATGCMIEQSSGSPELDAATCRAIERRFRFEPSRDADGNAVPATVVEDHTWMKNEG